MMSLHLRTSRGRLGGVAAAVTLAGPLLMLPNAQAAPSGTVTTVIAGLDSPRGLAIGKDGKLYVAEAGHGGADCPAGAKTPEGQPACFGTTGALTRVTGGKAIRVFTGLASIAGPAGIGAEGASAIGQGADGRWHVLMGLSPHETLPGLTASDTAVSNAQLGRLLSIPDTGTATILADPGDADWAWTNAHKAYAPKDFPDTNPFAMLIEPGRTDVIDSGSNILSFVTGAKVTPRAFFPAPAVGDAVPSCVTKGPDGALYVGELNAAGNKPGSARVWRIWPNHRPTIWRTGFTTMTGCGFDGRGNFYAVELQTKGFNPGPGGDPHGAVIKVSPRGVRTVLGAGQLFFPLGFAISGGALYVSNWSLFPATSQHGSPVGQIARIQL